MVADEDISAVGLLAPVQAFDCCAGSTCLLEADESTVGQCVVTVILLDEAGDNFSKFAEHDSELLLSGAFGKTLDENVVSSIGLLLRMLFVLTALVKHDLHRLASKVSTVGLLNCLGRISLVLILNIGIASACVICITLQFAFLDRAKDNEVIINLLLGQLRGQVAHHHVGFRIGLCVCLEGPHCHFTIDLTIIESFLAGERILFGRELSVAIIQRLVRLPI